MLLGPFLACYKVVFYVILTTQLCRLLSVYSSLSLEAGVEVNASEVNRIRLTRLSEPVLLLCFCHKHPQLFWVSWMIGWTTKRMPFLSNSSSFLKLFSLDFVSYQKSIPRCGVMDGCFKRFLLTNFIIPPVLFVEPRKKGFCLRLERCLGMDRWAAFQLKWLSSKIICHFNLSQRLCVLLSDGTGTDVYKLGNNCH